MTDPPTVVAFPFHDWRKVQREGIRTRDSHILQWLARDPRLGPLLVVDRPVSLVERVVRRRPVPVSGDLVAEASGPRWHAWLVRVIEGMYVVDMAVPGTIDVLRHPRGWWFKSGETTHVRHAIGWALGQVHEDGRPLATIAWTPTAAPIVRWLRSDRLVFDSLDNWLIHPVLRRERDRASAAYQELLPAANLVTVAAPASAAALAPIRGDIEIVPNGVDPDRFLQAGPRPADLPSGPVVGYAGKLAERIDIELCVATARSLPDVSFVFAGPILDRSVRRLAREPNVRLLGDRHPDALPALLQTFDIAWIPHRVGEGETGGDPIKLYEYWAAGRQVVTTPIDGYQGWVDRAFVITDAASAAATIRGIVDGRLSKDVWVDPDRTWSSIATRFADALVAEARY